MSLQQLPGHILDLPLNYLFIFPMDPTGEWEGEVPILRENSFLDDANDDMSLLGQNEVMQPAITSPIFI